MNVMIGAILLLAQPVYVIVELVTAARATVPYSFADNTVGDLGATSCGVVVHVYGQVPVCSPWHGLMNAGLIGFGLLLSAGFALVRPGLPDGPAATTAVMLWVVSGWSMIATGLVPIDQSLSLHTLVSLPALVTQPLGMLLLGVALRFHQPPVVLSAVGLGALSLLSALAYLTRADSASLGGLLERLALWPGYLWAPLFALAVLLNRARTAPAPRHRSAV